MSAPTSPAEAALFSGAGLVAEREREAAQRATLEQKLDEVERLMLSLDDFGWREALDDDAPIRARWATLRQRLTADSAS